MTLKPVHLCISLIHVVPHSLFLALPQQVEQVKIQKEQDGTSKGYGFIEFKSSDIAENAMKHLNGFELANQPIRVNYVNERSDDMETLDSEDMDIGIGMSASSRASLMAKLSEGHNAGEECGWGCGVGE